jgi:hypothetical protein
MNSNGDPLEGFDFRAAARFWEPQRLWYNAVLTFVVVLWVGLSWPHFRPALNLVALGKMLALALLANICYCAAYIAEFFQQAALPAIFWRKVRIAIWVMGMLLALLMENYWIADEIYPDLAQNTAMLAGSAADKTEAAMMASNTNFPAALAVLGFLAAGAGVFLGLATVMILWFARKPKFAQMAGIALGTGAVVYLGLLTGFSLASREKMLPRGQEKYFCEIDCHLAYSITDVKARNQGSSQDLAITLRTRFDESTISSTRPKDALLTPSPREVRLIDESGRQFIPISSSGPTLMTPLKPGDSYTTEFEFNVPQDAGGLRLLLNTTPGWPDHFVIGDENSWLHKKTYFAL